MLVGERLEERASGPRDDREPKCACRHGRETEEHVVGNATVKEQVDQDGLCFLARVGFEQPDGIAQMLGRGLAFGRNDADERQRRRNVARAVREIREQVSTQVVVYLKCRR